jgi:hypothetical protein
VNVNPAIRSREAWLSAAGIFVLALAVRAWAASAISFPIPEDTAYYFGVARNLLEGRGLVSDALWSFQTPPLVLPRPAFEVWLPLPAFVAAVPMALFGPTFQAGQVAAVIMGALVPVLAWRLAADVADEVRLAPMRARTLGLGTGIAATVYGPLVTHGALTDSTMPFTVIALSACLLMSRLLREPRGASVRDPRLLALGLALGLAALTRNEAAWLALVWAALAWWDPGRRGGGRLALDRSIRLRRILVPALVAVAVFAPWALRNLLVFGTPLPGQAAANAFSITGFDIFAWQDQPTLGRYVAQGVAAMLAARVDGFLHNLLSVLVLPGIPVGLIGLVSLPWTGRGAALRPLLLLCLVIFVITTLAFPVSTRWGTFLHAAGPVHVLLLVACLRALDLAIAAVGRRLGWTRPVAWLGPFLVVAVAAPLTVLSISTLGSLARETEGRHRDLERALEARGLLGSRIDEPSAAAGRPIISDHPVWIAEAWRLPAIALPDETPSSVVDLARTFGADLLIAAPADPDRPTAGGDDRWPEVLAQSRPGDPDVACFEPVDLRDPLTGAVPPSLEKIRVFRIVCR